MDAQDLIFRGVRLEINADINFVFDGGSGLLGNIAKKDEASEDDERERHNCDGCCRKPAIAREILKSEMENAGNDGEHNIKKLLNQDIFTFFLVANNSAVVERYDAALEVVDNFFIVRCKKDSRAKLVDLLK